MDLEQVELGTEVVTLIDLVCPMEHSLKVSNWIYERGGSTRRTGPKVKDYRADMSKYHVLGHIPGKWKQSEIEEQLKAL